MGFFQGDGDGAAAEGRVVMVYVDNTDPARPATPLPDVVRPRPRPWSGESPMNRDPRVDDYLEPLPDWQRETLQQVREVLHRADPEMTETIKRTVQPYFVLEGNVAAFLAARDHVNVFVYDGGIVPDPHGLVTAGHDNKTARTIGFREGDVVPEEALLEFFRRLVADNRAGGWRTLKDRPLSRFDEPHRGHARVKACGS